MKIKQIISSTCLLLALSSPLNSLAADSHGGTIKETVNSGGYTYMLIDGDGKETWVAIPATTVKVGDNVNYVHGITMENFSSKTLNRSFENIVFSQGLTQEQPSKPSNNLFASAVAKEKDSSVPIMEESGGSSASVTAFADLDIAKASGSNGYSIEELYENKSDLAGKTINVHGKVMKINENIMGKNWIHLQDGTGDPMKNSHDLVITSQDAPAKGAIVTFQGKVVLDKDFGYSYKYDLLIEDAKIAK